MHHTDMFDALEIQIWTADRGGALTFVNEFTVTYFDRSRERLVDEGWQDVLHAADVPVAVQRWKHSIETGEPYEVHFRLIRGSDRIYRWHRASARLLETDQGPMWLGSNVDCDAERRSDEILQAREQLAAKNAGEGG